MKILRTLATCAAVLAVAACADTPTNAPAADDARLLASSGQSAGEITVGDVDDLGDRWEATFSTPKSSSVVSYQWDVLSPSYAVSSTSGSTFVAARDKDDDAGCVEVSLTTTFTDSSTKFRTAAVYVGGIIPECADPTWGTDSR